MIQIINEKHELNGPSRFGADCWVRSKQEKQCGQPETERRKVDSRIDISRFKSGKTTQMCKHTHVSKCFTSRLLASHHTWQCSNSPLSKRSAQKLALLVSKCASACKNLKNGDEAPQKRVKMGAGYLGRRNASKKDSRTGLWQNFSDSFGKNVGSWCNLYFDAFSFWHWGFRVDLRESPFRLLLMPPFHVFHLQRSGANGFVAISHGALCSVILEALWQNPVKTILDLLVVLTANPSRSTANSYENPPNIGSLDNSRELNSPNFRFSGCFRGSFFVFRPRERQDCHHRDQTWRCHRRSSVPSMRKRKWSKKASQRQGDGFLGE